MNLSLKKRVAFSFITSIVIIVVISFTVFNFLNSLNKQIETISSKSTFISQRTAETRISAVAILKYTRRLSYSDKKDELVETIISICDSFSGQLKSLESVYNKQEAHKVITQMSSFVETLKLILNKTSFTGRDSAVGLSSIGELADKILDSFSEFQDIQIDDIKAREKRLKKIINETKKNMMITIIIGFLGTIILSLVIPGKIALPFKKIRDAIRELQECNFDVSIYYNQEDEIGEIAREMNKMIRNLKVFEELRTDRISVEARKFDALANMIKKPVIMANARGQVIYMNNRLYSLMQMSSDEVLHKDMDDTMLPKSIIESFELAIKRRSKIENNEIEICAKHKEVADVQVLNEIAQEKAKSDEEGEVLEEKKEEEEIIFQGFANVIPIRGKESSLDYYLMVLSKEVFV